VFHKFDKAPPGHSLTQPKGKWAWDKPPVFSEPMQAVDFVIGKMKQPSTEKGYIKMMLAGVSIEDLTQSVLIGGFAKGFFSPDVGALIQPSIAIYLMGVAVDNNIPVRVFSDTKEGLAKFDEGMDDMELLDAVRLQNPEIYNTMREREIEQAKKSRARSAGMLGVAAPTGPTPDMFAGPEEGPEMEEEA